MSSDIPNSLARIQESASRLNAMCDQAGESVKSLEAFLARAHAGVEAHVVVWTRGDDSMGEQLLLCYGRYGAAYRVHLEWYIDAGHPDDRVTSKAWSECKRDDKLLTLPLMGDLVERIEEAVLERESQATHALDAIRNFIDLASASDQSGGEAPLSSAKSKKGATK